MQALLNKFFATVKLIIIKLVNVKRRWSHKSHRAVDSIFGTSNPPMHYKLRWHLLIAPRCPSWPSWRQALCRNDALNMLWAWCTLCRGKRFTGSISHLSASASVKFRDTRTRSFGSSEARSFIESRIQFGAIRETSPLLTIVGCMRRKQVNYVITNCCMIVLLLVLSSFMLLLIQLISFVCSIFLSQTPSDTAALVHISYAPPLNAASRCQRRFSIKKLSSEARSFIVASASACRQLPWARLKFAFPYSLPMYAE